MGLTFVQKQLLHPSTELYIRNKARSWGGGWVVLASHTFILVQGRPPKFKLI